LRVDGVRRRWKPHMGDPGGGDVVHLALQVVVPSGSSLVP
jgi:hypothetical protein